jgi:[ribosomal protein S5]-alanine N-acetyltransferase
MSRAYRMLRCCHGGTRCPQRVGSDASPDILRLRRLTSPSEKPIHLVRARKQRGEPSLIMQLQTARLILRRFREEDVDVMAQLFANPDFMRFSLGVYTERKQTVAFIDKVIGWDRAGIPSQFAVVPRGEEAIVGYCGFFQHAEVPGEIEIGYRLDPDYWNRGLITEAARAVRDHGFADLKLPRVISLIHPENIPSRRVAEKNGMKVEKEITFRGFPTLVYAITREEWLANRDAS